MGHRPFRCAGRRTQVLPLRRKWVSRTSSVSTGTSIHFWCVFVSGRISSTFINISCDSGTFSELLSISMQLGDLQSIPCNFQCSRETFRKLPSNIRSARKLSVNFLCGRKTFCQLPVSFRVAGRLSVNFCELSVRQIDLPSTSVYFPCDRKTFRHFHQLFLRPGDFPSTYVNLLCGRGPSLKFCQLSIP